MESRTRDPFFSTERDLDEKEQRAIAREALMFNLTEDLLVTMEREGVTRADLARRLGCTRSAITQALKGRNLKLSTLSDLCHALGLTPRVSLERERTGSADESAAGEEDRGAEAVDRIGRVGVWNDIDAPVDRARRSARVLSDNVIRPDVSTWYDETARVA